MPYESTVLGVARGLAVKDAVVRARSADEVTDVIRELEHDDAALLAYLLIAVRCGETDATARESQLHALSSLAEWHEMPTGVLKLVDEVPPSTVTGSEVEYMQYLRNFRTS